MAIAIDKKKIQQPIDGLLSIEEGDELCQQRQIGGSKKLPNETQGGEFEHQPVLCFLLLDKFLDSFYIANLSKHIVL